MEVELPDGRILEFPEGTSQDVMRTAIQKLLGQPTPASASGGTSQADIDAGLVPSGDTDTRSTAQVVGQPSGAGMDQMRSLSAPMMDTARQAWQGATGQGPSVTGEALQGGIPIGYGDARIPVSEGVANTVGRVADAGLAALSFGGGLASGGAGVVGDTAEALGVPGADRLGRELAAMPEAFAGSPQQVMRQGASLPSRATPEAPTAARAATAAPTMDAATLGGTVRQAGSGSRRATRVLAQQADVDPSAAAATERLGMDLPADVLSNNQLIKESAGLTRSLAGTEASSSWRDTIVRAADRATEVMRDIGGSTDLSGISASVRAKLDWTRENLQTKAKELYSAVDADVGAPTVVRPRATAQTVQSILDEMGGDVSGLTTQEGKLYQLLTSETPVTYGRLMREKRDVQRALRSQSGPYADADEFALRRLESALVRDQLEIVEGIGGTDLRGNLELANRLTAQRKDLENTIVGAFGRDGEGSIATKLRSAITSASKGDLAGLNRVINVIPEELRAEAVATALTSVSQSARASDPGFGFAEFARTYDGLRKNPEALRRVTTAIGSDASRTLNDLYDISRRITDARANVLTTGKSNQALMQGMTAEGLLTRVLDTSIGRNITRIATTSGGAAAGGPMGAGAAAGAGETLIRALSNRGNDRLQQAGKMFNSPDFRNLAVEAATGTPTQSSIRRVVKSAPYRNWARLNKIQDPEAWLVGALTAAQTAQPEQPAPQSAQ